MNMKLAHVIAEREYRMVTQGRKQQKVHVRFGKPRPAPGGNGYMCLGEFRRHEEDGRAR